MVKQKFKIDHHSKLLKNKLKQLNIYLKSLMTDDGLSWCIVNGAQLSFFLSLLLFKLSLFLSGGILVLLIL